MSPQPIPRRLQHRVQYRQHVTKSRVNLRQHRQYNMRVCRKRELRLPILYRRNQLRNDCLQALPAPLALAELNSGIILVDHQRNIPNRCRGIQGLHQNLLSLPQRLVAPRLRSVALEQLLPKALTVRALEFNGAAKGFLCSPVCRVAQAEGLIRGREAVAETGLLSRAMDAPPGSACHNRRTLRPSRVFSSLSMHWRSIAVFSDCIVATMRRH